MKSNLAKVSLALLSAVFILGCQDLGSGPVGPDGLVPQFAKGGVKGKPGGDNQFVFVDVVLTGWMETNPLNQINQMELARKNGIMKIRANTEKHGTKFLHFAINMENTLATFTLGNLNENLAALRNNCAWSGRVEQTLENETWVIEVMLPGILNDDDLVVERSVLVVVDESALVETSLNSGVFVGVSEDNRMNISGLFVRGSPTVTVLGNPAGDDFTATFSGGKVEMRGIPPEERNQIILSCNIFDDITFTVMPQTS